ncbi:MAG TPA: four helix bundle protein, partial [Chitinophagaceae bacterium]|nr:four helix bundle protein [Chitinophagaceae bacterium]
GAGCGVENSTASGRFRAKFCCNNAGSLNPAETFARMSYRDLEIWQLARELVIDIHRLTLTLPKFEMFEVSQQIRRSIKSVKSAIVEGYGRRRYTADYIKYLVYAHASTDETIDHLETLFETGSLTDEVLYNKTKVKLNNLGAKINRFIIAIEKRQGH